MIKKQIELAESLLKQVDEYYSDGNTLDHSLRMAIRNFSEELGFRLGEMEERIAIDELGKLWLSERKRCEME